MYSSDTSCIIYHEVLIYYAPCFSLDTGAGPIAAAVVVPVIIAIVATIIVIAVSFGCWKRNKGKYN